MQQEWLNMDTEPKVQEVDPLFLGAGKVKLRSILGRWALAIALV